MNWNGWLVPHLTREEADKFIAYQQKLRDELQEVVLLAWDGDTLVASYHDPADGEQRITPELIEVDGQDIKVWNVGLGLVWEELDPANIDRVVERVAEELATMGVQCSYEYQPGFICVPVSGGQSFAIGVANENWTGNLMDKDGDPVVGEAEEDYYRSEIPSDCHDVKRIATSIKAFLDNWNTSTKGGAH
jgi:hypothetical protein